MFRAALLIIVEIISNSDVHQLMDSHTMDCYSASKRNEVLIYVTTWMNFENMMLSEKSQTQKATFV